MGITSYACLRFFKFKPFLNGRPFSVMRRVRFAEGWAPDVPPQDYDEPVVYE